MEIVFFIVAIFVVGVIHHSKEKPFSFQGKQQKDDDFSKKEAPSEKEPEFSKVFNETFLALASYVIKSDGDIAHIELQQVKRYFRTYYPKQEDAYFDRLNLYLKQEVDLKDSCQTIINAEFQDKFQMMCQLFNIASADNHIYISEYVALYDIFNLLNLPNLTFISIRGLFNVSFTQKEVADFKEILFRKRMEDWHKRNAENEEQRRRREQQRQYQYRQEQQKHKEQQRKQHEKRKQEQYNYKKQSNYNNYQKKGDKDTYSKKSTSKLENAYSIIGLKKGASLKEIKKAYRRLAHLHHPDKVAHLGEGSVKQAEMVFRKIKDAYEMVVNSLKL